MLSGEREVRSNRIGELVLEALKHLDTIAYIRFASVYFNINDPEAFIDMIHQAVRERNRRDVRTVTDAEQGNRRLPAGLFRRG